MGSNPGKYLFSKLNDMIIWGSSPSLIIRMLVIWSYTSGGIKQNEYETLISGLVSTYGFQEMETIQSMMLENILLVKNFGGTPAISYKQLIKTFKLIDVDYKDKNPNGKSFPYMAYTPLIPRLFDLLIHGEWVQPSIIKKLPHPFFGHGNPGFLLNSVKLFDKFRRKINDKNRREITEKLSKVDRPVVAVFVIGGLTYAEISCFRNIAQRSGLELIICVTEVINGKKMIDGFRNFSKRRVR